MNQPVESASLLPTSKQGEAQSAVGPKIEKGDGAGDKSKDSAVKGIEVSQDIRIESTEIDFSKWKLEKIGDQNLFLKTDTEKLLLPKWFWRKCTPRLYINEDKTFIISSEGDALEVRKDKNKKLMFIKTEIPVSDTDKSKSTNRLDESVDNDPDKLEKHNFPDNAARSSGKDEENTELNDNISNEMNKENLGDRSGPSVHPAKLKNSSDSKQFSISAMLTTLDSNKNGREETLSKTEFDENVSEKRNSAGSEISTMQEVGKNPEPDDICKEPTDTSASDINQKEVKDVIYNDITGTSPVKKSVTFDSELENVEHSLPASADIDNQQTAMNFEKNPESDRKLSCFGNHLEEQFTDGTNKKVNLQAESKQNEKVHQPDIIKTEKEKAAEIKEDADNIQNLREFTEEYRANVLETKRDELETLIGGLLKMKIDETTAEGTDSDNRATRHGNPLEDGEEQPHEDMKPRGKVNGT